MPYLGKNLPVSAITVKLTPDGCISNKAGGGGGGEGVEGSPMHPKGGQLQLMALLNLCFNNFELHVLINSQRPIVLAGQKCFFKPRGISKLSVGNHDPNPIHNICKLRIN